MQHRKLPQIPGLQRLTAAQQGLSALLQGLPAPPAQAHQPVTCLFPLQKVGHQLLMFLPLHAGQPPQLSRQPWAG
jgi:hypothetical protein